MALNIYHLNNKRFKQKKKNKFSIKPNLCSFSLYRSAVHYFTSGSRLLRNLKLHECTIPWGEVKTSCFLCAFCFYPMDGLINSKMRTKHGNNVKTDYFIEAQTEF
jgi:hypothetical protein